MPLQSINTATKGTYFFDYGNAFLLEASRAGADIMSDDGKIQIPLLCTRHLGTYVF